MAAIVLLLSAQCPHCPLSLNEFRKERYFYYEKLTRDGVIPELVEKWIFLSSCVVHSGLVYL
jgi:hypothetical protein